MNGLTWVFTLGLSDQPVDGVYISVSGLVAGLMSQSEVDERACAPKLTTLPVRFVYEAPGMGNLSSCTMNTKGGFPSVASARAPVDVT